MFRKTKITTLWCYCSVSRRNNMFSIVLLTFATEAFEPLTTGIHYCAHLNQLFVLRLVIAVVVVAATTAAAAAAAGGREGKRSRRLATVFS